jgi:hypothetical protein
MPIILSFGHFLNFMYGSFHLELLCSWLAFGHNMSLFQFAWRSSRPVHVAINVYKALSFRCLMCTVCVWRRGRHIACCCTYTQIYQGLSSKGFGSVWSKPIFCVLLGVKHFTQIRRRRVNVRGYDVNPVNMSGGVRVRGRALTGNC